MLHVSSAVALLGCLLASRRQATRGVERRLRDEASIHVAAQGEVYARDEFVYWGFTEGSLHKLGQLAGFASWEVLDQPIVDGHPRILGTFSA